MPEPLWRQICYNEQAGCKRPRTRKRGHPCVGSGQGTRSNGGHEAGGKANLGTQELDQMLFAKRGCKGITVAYFTRQDGILPLEADYPG